MALRIGADRHLEVADLADAAHQVGGIAIAFRMRHEAGADAARRIAPEGHDVVDAGIAELADHRVDFVLAGADAGEVGCRFQARFPGDSRHGRQRAVASGAARAIGDRDEGGMHRLEFRDGAPEGGLGLAGLGREELEGDGQAACRIGGGHHGLASLVR